MWTLKVLYILMTAQVFVAHLEDFHLIQPPPPGLCHILDLKNLSFENLWSGYWEKQIDLIRNDARITKTTFLINYFFNCHYDIFHETYLKSFIVTYQLASVVWHGHNYNISPGLVVFILK